MHADLLGRRDDTVCVFVCVWLSHHGLFLPRVDSYRAAMTNPKPPLMRSFSSISAMPVVNTVFT